MDIQTGIFLNKPEMIIGFPDEMLPAQLVQSLASAKDAAIVELAGRDSVAGAVAAARAGGIGQVLPTYAFTGTEHGQWAEVPRALERLKAALPGHVKVHGLVVLGSPLFWQALCGIPLTGFFQEFGFSPICVGCHLYLHAVRLPLARLLGDAPIISGERHSHDGRIKINQLPRSLEAYRSLAADFGLSLLHPLAEVEDGGEVAKLVGAPWPEGGQQLGCVLSGNYQDIRTGATPTEQQLSRYLETFALPLAKQVIEDYMAGNTPDHLALARRIVLDSF